MKELFDKYSKLPELAEISAEVQALLQKKKDNYKPENLKKAFGLIDLTTLNAADTEAQVIDMCEKVNNFHQFSKFVGVPNVAAICVYPALVKTVKNNLKAKYTRIASVSGGFPASQTFLSVKCDETKLAVQDGANDIDMVISLGKFFENKYEEVAAEIKAMKEACGDAHLKVILESGAMESTEQIHRASIIAIESGADFLKTSTGKFYPPASLEAIYIMAHVVKEYYKLTGKKVGLKPAGGIKTGKDAVEYITVVKEILGNQWINAELLRIGASSLANNILTEIYHPDGKDTIKHF